MLFTNEGWEVGAAGDWVFTDSGNSEISVTTDNPRTGSYNLHFNTASSSIRWGRAKYTITDTAILADLSGQVVIFSVWARPVLVFAGGAGSFRQLELGDEGSETTQALPITPDATYSQVSVTHTVKANPTEVHFAIYWYKSGSGSIYHYDIDDMVSDPVSTPSMFKPKLFFF